MPLYSGPKWRYAAALSSSAINTTTETTVAEIAIPSFTFLNNYDQVKGEVVYYLQNYTQASNNTVGLAAYFGSSSPAGTKTLENTSSSAITASNNKNRQGLMEFKVWRISSTKVRAVLRNTLIAADGANTGVGSLSANGLINGPWAETATAGTTFDPALPLYFRITATINVQASDMGWTGENVIAWQV